MEFSSVYCAILKTATQKPHHSPNDKHANMSRDEN